MNDAVLRYVILQFVRDHLDPRKVYRQERLIPAIIPGLQSVRDEVGSGPKLLDQL